MNEKLARLKLTAYLHDPPQKPLVLHLGHEVIARDLARMLVGDVSPEEASLVRQADHLAAAADRVVLGDQRVSFLSHPQLTHPLSGLPPHELAPLGPAVEPRALNEVAVEAVRQVRERASSLEAAYLTIWRYLPEYLRAVEPAASRLGALWHYLPADTRVPDHSIWSHQSVAAALATAIGDGKARPAFLVFGLGPVQDFIATARTTRDLWAGSYLLSTLAWEAIRSVIEEWGPDCILYPSLRGIPLVDAWLSARGARPPDGIPMPLPDRAVASFPNKFLALMPADRAAVAGRQAAQAVDAAWAAILGATRELVNRSVAATDGASAWDRQGSTLLEKYWVTLDWPSDQIDDWLAAVDGYVPGEAGRRLRTALQHIRSIRPTFVNAGTAYDAAHALVQRAYDRRKGLRDFRPVAEPGYKCTLCGVRAPVVAGDASYREQRDAWRELARRIEPGLLAPDGTERLCAVCLSKRLAPRHGFGGLADTQEAFPSTSTVATLPFRDRLLAALGDDDLALCAWELADAMDELGRSPEARESGIHPRVSADLQRRLLQPARPLRGGAREIAERLARVDGEWFLRETYDRRERESGMLVQGLLSRARQALEALTRQAAPTCGRPSPYYALLLADGDRMGHWVTGVQHKITVGERLHSDVRRELERSGEVAELLTMPRLLGPSGHAALGAALRDYAHWTVPYTLETEGRGFVVYAGGDDVLALLPAPEALAAAARLRRLYAAPFVAIDEAGRVDDHLPSSGRTVTVATHLGPDASLSAGLVFAHHLYPLNGVLGYARELEERAKEIGGRDALAVGTVRRSGPDLGVVGKWQNPLDSAAPGLVEAIRVLRDLLVAGDAAGPRLARGFPAVVRQLADSGVGGSAPELPWEAQDLLLRALARRHARPSGAGETVAAAANAAFRAVGRDLGQLAEACSLARFLAEEVG